MTKNEPGWDLYRGFLAVVRHRSLSAAARALASTQPTLGRQIEALERALGVSLFTRSPNGLAPSPAALALVPQAEAMAAAAAALLRAASGEAEEGGGTVRLTASEMVGGEVLPAMLAGFRRLHPRIAIELVLNNDAEDLLRRDADIAVRMFRPTQGALVARRIGQVEIGLYAHRRYAEAHGLPAGVDELGRHALIGFDRSPLFARAVGRVGAEVSREQLALRCDSDLAQLAAMRAGFGIGAVQAGVAGRDPDLLPVLPGQLSLALDIWLAMHRDMRGCRRVVLLFDYLAAALAEYVAGGRGGAGAEPV